MYWCGVNERGIAAFVLPVLLVLRWHVSGIEMRSVLPYLYPLARNEAGCFLGSKEPILNELRNEGNSVLILMAGA